MSWVRAGMIVTVGLFFNMLLPGLVGGDAMRFTFSFRRCRVRNCGARSPWRWIGLWDWRPCCARGDGGVTPFSLVEPRYADCAYHLSRARHPWRVNAVCAARFRRNGDANAPRRLPFYHSIVQIGKALRLYREHPTMIARAFLVTIFSHLAYYISYYCALRSLPSPPGGEPSMVDFLSIMPLVNTITGVPISFGGVGVRETLFQTLLGQLTHVPPALGR